MSRAPRVLAEVKLGLRERFLVDIAADEEHALAALQDCDFGKNAPEVPKASEIHEAPEIPEVPEAPGTPEVPVGAVVICVDAAKGIGAASYARLAGRAFDMRIPTLFLAEVDDERDEAEAFAIGADDYAVRRRSGYVSLARRLSLRIAPSNEARARAAAPECRDVKKTALDPGAAASCRNTDASQGDGSELGAAVLCGKTILIAEDVELNRDIMEAMLSGVDGLRLEFARDGAEAVAMFANAITAQGARDAQVTRNAQAAQVAPASREAQAARNSQAAWDAQETRHMRGVQSDQENPAVSVMYDAIFMDVNMPVLDGLEATRAIRCLEAEASRGNRAQGSGEARVPVDAAALRPVPIIALTATMDDGAVASARAAGMDGFLLKPVDLLGFAAAFQAYCVL